LPRGLACDPARAAADAAAFGAAGAGLAIVYLPAPHVPAVLEPLASALSALRGGGAPGRRGDPRRGALALGLMNTPIAGNANLFLVVGYDGSPPSSRALDAAARLLQGRSGRIDVVYVAHLPAVDMLSAGAVAEMEVSFDEIERDLRASVSKQLDGREDRWRFERGQGIITDQLLAAATNLRDEHPGDTVSIVVGSSSQAAHRLVGSVAVSLARRSPVPVVIVP
jgi:nucleotide-binding universal stress UspA family protein